MSRIWKVPIVILSEVTVILNWSLISVKWPKWELEYLIPNWVILKIEGNSIFVSVESDDLKNLWGLVRTLIFNMIEGVTKGYEKKLLVRWVWYNVKIQGSNLILNLGYSHPIEYKIPTNIQISTEKNPKWEDIVVISGIDKQKVWEVAAKIKKYRLPEPYKGKWIRYIDEEIKLKAGKTAKK
jgi:large subunit ribosomal protein L6